MNLLAMLGCAEVGVRQPQGWHAFSKQTIHTASSLRYNSDSSTKAWLWGLSGTRGERSRDCDPTDPHPLYLLVHSRVSTNVYSIDISSSWCV